MFLNFFCWTCLRFKIDFSLVLTIKLKTWLTSKKLIERNSSSLTTDNSLTKVFKFFFLILISSNSIYELYTSCFTNCQTTWDLSRWVGFHVLTRQPRPQSNFRKIALPLLDFAGNLYLIWFVNCEAMGINLCNAWFFHNGWFERSTPRQLI